MLKTIRLWIARRNLKNAQTAMWATLGTDDATVRAARVRLDAAWAAIRAVG